MFDSSMRFDFFSFGIVIKTYGDIYVGSLSLFW